MDQKKRNIHEIELPWQDIFHIASGTDSEGNPNASAALSLDEIVSEDQVKNRKQVFLKNAVLGIHVSGGCAALQIDFPKNSTFYYRQAWKLCSDWINRVNAGEENQQTLSITVVPHAFYGQIFFLFHQLVYFDGHPVGEKNRLILAFDNQQSVAVKTDAIDYDQILQQADMLLAQEEEALDQEISALREEKEQLENSNPFADQIDHMMEHTPVETTGALETGNTNDDRFRYDRQEDPFRFFDSKEEV